MNQMQKPADTGIRLRRSLFMIAAFRLIPDRYQKDKQHNQENQSEDSQKDQSQKFQDTE
jgi:hypothetical protein